MTPLDGLYRHDDVSMVWDEVGVTFTNQTHGLRGHADWNVIDGARQIGGRPGFVQLLIRGHVPPADPRADPFSIAVVSEADAKRLITSILWRPRTPRRRERSRRRHQRHPINARNMIRDLRIGHSP